MKKYLHAKEIKIPLYVGKLVIIFTNDEETLKKKYPDVYLENSYSYAYFDGEKNADKFYIVLNFHHPIKKICHGNISHESLHITNFILNDRGVVSDFENDEPVTYLLDWISNEVYKFARDKKMKIEYAD